MSGSSVYLLKKNRAADHVTDLYPHLPRRTLPISNLLWSLRSDEHLVIAFLDDNIFDFAISDFTSKVNREHITSKRRKGVAKSLFEAAYMIYCL